MIFEDDINENYLRKIDEYANEIGIKFKFLIFKNLNSCNTDDRPCFYKYKYTIDDGEPIVPTGAMLERVFLLSNHRYNSDEVLEFLMDVMPSLAAPRSHLILYYIFFA